MPTRPTPPTKHARTNQVSWGVIATSMLAALSRLAVVSALGACLVIALLNEVAAALVYLIAAVLALFWACSP